MMVALNFFHTSLSAGRDFHRRGVINREQPETTLFNPKTLAVYLDIPVATLYDWRRKGVGPPGIRVGKHLRYRQRDVEAWLDRQTPG